MSVYRHPYMCCVWYSDVKRMAAKHEPEGEGSSTCSSEVVCIVKCFIKPKILAICKKTIYLNL